MNGSKTFTPFVGSNSTVPAGMSDIRNCWIPSSTDSVDNVLRSAFVPRFDTTPFYSIPHLAQYGSLRGTVIPRTNSLSQLSPFAHVAAADHQNQQNLLSQFILSQSAFGPMTDGQFNASMSSPYLSPESAFFPTNRAPPVQRYLAPPTVSSDSTTQKIRSPSSGERSATNKNEIVLSRKCDLGDVSSDGKPFVVQRPFMLSERSKISSMDDDNNKNVASARLASASLPIQPYYPSHFMKGTIIQLADGTLKPVEDLNTEDFVRSAYLTDKLKINTSTVTKIEKKSADVVALHFSVGETKVQVSVEATIEHPFFVIGQGWSSCNPERTENLYGLPCQRLQVGDVCISLTQNDETPKKCHEVDASQKTTVNETNSSKNGNHQHQKGRKVCVPSVVRWSTSMDANGLKAVVDGRKGVVDGGTGVGDGRMIAIDGHTSLAGGRVGVTVDRMGAVGGRTGINGKKRNNTFCHLPTNCKRLKPNFGPFIGNRYIKKSRSMPPTGDKKKFVERKLSVY